MVGAAVDKGYSQYSNHKNVALITNTSSPTTITTWSSTETLFADNSSTTIPTLPTSDDVPIKLGYAMAVTFLVGCIQVESIEQFFFFLFYWTILECQNVPKMT